MIDPAAARKAVELDCKLASLRSELDAWLAASEAQGRLEKHHTQIRAVARALDGPIEQASERLRLARDDGLLGQAIQIETMVLEIHRIWNFFREKLALRYVEHFEPALIAADELAWRCYQSAQAQVTAGRGREPPLVYFNGASSPLTLERGKRFQPEAVAGEPVRWGVTAAAIEALPVPVLGIPWFQVEHLPDASIIAHEVGHDVEVDLGLTDSIHELLAGVVADDDRRRAWDAWAGEVFADVYGTLALGPAFAATLVDFLAGDPHDVETEERLPGDGATYPTTALRVLLAAAVLEATGFAAEAGELRARVPTHAMTDYERDLEPVAGALVAGPYPQIGGGRLDGLIDFPGRRHRQAQADARRLLMRMDPLNEDARVLVAAARLAFDNDPARYVASGASARVLARIEVMRDVGVRAGPGGRGATSVTERTLERRDKEAGAAITTMLTGGIDVQAQDR